MAAQTCWRVNNTNKPNTNQYKQTARGKCIIVLRRADV